MKNRGGGGASPALCVELRFRRHMRHVAPLSPVTSLDCAYFPSPQGWHPFSALPTLRGLGIIQAHMQFQSIQNAIDLLGPAPPPPPPSDQKSPEQLAGRVAPKIEIAWGSFHQGFWSSVAALFGPSAAKNSVSASAFRDSW